MNDMRNKVSGLWTFWQFEAYVTGCRSALTSLKPLFGVCALGSAPLTLLEASLEHALVMLCSFAWSSALISAVFSKRLPFTWIVIFWNRNKSQGAKLGDWAMKGTDSVFFFLLPTAGKTKCFVWHVGMMQKPVPSATFFCAFSRHILPQLPLYIVNPPPTVLFDDFTQFFHIFFSPTWRWATRISKILNPRWVTFESWIPIKGLCPQDVMQRAFQKISVFLRRSF